MLLLLHVDNEKAADHLITLIGQKYDFIEWIAVKADGLTNEEEVPDYEIYSSPIRSPIFNADKTCRINFGHFMTELISKEDLWNKWKGQMPVIYNKSCLD